MDATQRKCRVCGTIINYSKQDWKANLIPDDPICSLCLAKQKPAKPKINEEDLPPVIHVPFDVDKVVEKWEEKDKKAEKRRGMKFRDLAFDQDEK
jgi:hypothetical protein